jgi:hypothetical protein
VHDASRTVRRFAREFEFARRFGIEVCAARDKLAGCDAALL